MALIRGAVLALLLPAVFSLGARADSQIIDIAPCKTDEVFAASEAPDIVRIETIGIAEQETRVQLVPYGCATESEHAGACYRRVVRAHVPVVRVLVTYARSSAASPDANPWVDEFRFPLAAWKAGDKVSFVHQSYSALGYSERYGVCPGDPDHPDCDPTAVSRRPVDVPMVKVEAVIN
jgi:hypothetical protein